MLHDHTIAFVGSGNMAEALIKGLIQVIPSDRIVAADVAPQRRQTIRDRYQIQVSAENYDVVKNADIIILAVKPQVIPAVLPEIAPEVTDRQLVISIAAGVKIAAIQAALPTARVIRVMPNVAALVHAAVTAISPGTRATETDLQMAQDIFHAVGETVVVGEHLMDAVTGLSGSGPAYVFAAINALADGGVKAGLPRDAALKLAAHTVYGAAKMLIETGEHPMQLRDLVTSPGGTTIAGLHALQRDGFSAALMNAVETAAQRSYELGNPETTT